MKNIITTPLRFSRQQCLAAMVAGFVLTATGSAATFTYGFETASAGSLGNNDNWLGGNNVTVTTSNPPTGYSGKYVTSTSDSQYSRVNDSAFGYSLDNTHTITISFLLRGGNSLGSQLFSLGGNLDGLGVMATNETAFQFGLLNNNWFVREAGNALGYSAASGLPLNGSDTYEVRLVADPVAYSGDGSGNFSFRNISTGGAWTDVAELQNLNLGMLNMVAGARNPSEWNSIRLRLSSGRMDTLTITQVPEPSAALLGGLGLLVAFRRKRA